MGDAVVFVALGIFQGEVFELGFYAVETQPVGERRIEVGGFIGDVFAELGVGVVVDHAHEAQSVGNHDDNHAHVLGKSEQQVAEVVALYGLLLGIEAAGLDEAANDFYAVGAEEVFDPVEGDAFLDDEVASQYGRQRAAVETHLL